MRKVTHFRGHPLVNARLAQVSKALSSVKPEGFPGIAPKHAGRRQFVSCSAATKNVLEVDRPEGLNGARFSVPVHVEYGDRVVIVGSDPALGSWVIDNAVLLEWTDGDVWEGIVDLTPGHHEFKCVVLNNKGLTWESGPNRTVAISPPGGETRIRCQMWDTNITFVESVHPPSEAQDSTSQKIETIIENGADDIDSARYTFDPVGDSLKALDSTETASVGSFIVKDSSPDEGLAEAILVANAHIIPHSDKTKSGGEDAYFVSGKGLGAVGVADGVSGWSRNGVDPAIYPQTLLHHSKLAFENHNEGVGPVEMMRIAQNQTKLTGSCTACIATMRSGTKLEIANLGDSGFRLIREGVVIVGSKVQEEGFNFPYQLGHPSLMPRCHRSEDADRYSIDVCLGDILVMGSDGLFDNIWDNDLTELVAASMTNKHLSEESAKELSRTIAQAAHANASDETCYVPWTIDATKEAKKRGWLPEEVDADDNENPYKGGKMDDCCVVAAFVCRK